MCRAYQTSKLEQYDDIFRISTLGFRGEALHALCSVASVTILTKRKLDASNSNQTKTNNHSGNSGILNDNDNNNDDNNWIWKLCFDHTGELVSSEKVESDSRLSRHGTIVLISKLFEQTPLRAKIIVNKQKEQAKQLEELFHHLSILCKIFNYFYYCCLFHLFQN